MRMPFPPTLLSVTTQLLRLENTRKFTTLGRIFVYGFEHLIILFYINSSLLEKYP